MADNATTPCSTATAPEATFAQGFLAMLPLWAGAIPVGIAFGVAAVSSGLGPVAAQAMSLFVFSAAAQLSVVALVAGGAPPLVPLLTTVLLNVHMLLLGLAAARAARPRRGMRLLTAFFLTDGAYAVALGVGRLAMPALLGAGVSMYLGWNIGTALGLLLGHTISNPRCAGVDLVAPLMFLAVLAPLVRGRAELLCALLAAGTSLFVLHWLPAGLAVLTGCLAGGLTGAALPVRWAR